MVRASIEKELGELSLLNFPRSIALQSALMAFELAASQILAMVLESGASEGTYENSIGERVKIEDALCILVPLIWEKCRDSHTYQTSLDMASLFSAFDAIDSVAKTNLLESQLQATRSDQVSIIREGDTIIVRPAAEVPQWQYGLANRSRKLELMWEQVGIDAAKNSLAASPDTFLATKARLESEMRLHGMRPATELGGYRAADFVEVWAAILDIAGPLQWSNNSKMEQAWHGREVQPRTFFSIRRERDLLNSVSARCNVDGQRISSIIGRLMYKGQKHETSVFLYPIIPVGADFVALAPAVITLAEPFRNLRQRMIVDERETYSKVQRELSNTTTRDVAETLRAYGYSTVMGKKIRDKMGRILTDADLVGATSNSVLVIQMKNLNPTETPQEYARIPEEIAKAEQQLDASMEYVGLNLEKLFPRTEFVSPRIIPLILTGVRLTYGLKQPKWLYASVLELPTILQEIQAGLDPLQRMEPSYQGKIFGIFSVGGQKYNVEFGTHEGQIRTLDYDRDMVIDDLREIIMSSGVKF